MSSDKPHDDKSTPPRDAQGARIGNIAQRNQELAANLARILSLFDSKDPSLNQVAKEMQKHDEVASEVLRSVNTVGFGLQHNVKHVEHAVAILGQKGTLSFLREQIKRRESAGPAISAMD